MKTFFVIGLIWVFIQLVSNRIAFYKYASTNKIPFAIFFGGLMEFFFIIALISYIL